MELLTKAMEFLPVLVAANMVLSALGSVFDKLQVALHKEGASSIGTWIGKISGYVKMALDFASANLKH